LKNNFFIINTGPIKRVRGSQASSSAGASQNGSEEASRRVWACGCSSQSWKPAYLSTNTTLILKGIWAPESYLCGELQVTGQITCQIKVIKGSQIRSSRVAVRYLPW